VSIARDKQNDDKPHGVQTAFVTGAAKRLGRAVALGLAEHGFNVVVHYGRSAREAESVADEIRRHGVRAWTLQADLSELRQTEGLVHAALDLAGPLHLLVNNASIFGTSTWSDFTSEDLNENIRVNALGPHAMAQAFAQQGQPGLILNFLDTKIHEYDAEHVAYHLSKRMLFTLTRIMAAEYAPEIRVNAIAPGLILPPEGKDRGYLEKLAHTNPLNRVGSPEDIVRAVLFLVESPFITGQVIYVDGGRHMEAAFYG
jgi:pteridine reductase